MIRDLLDLRSSVCRFLTFYEAITFDEDDNC
jgi:hypothetical protein